MSDQPPTFHEHLAALEREGVAFVAVTLVEAVGSTPQDTGAKMIVTTAGLHHGTVGGGRVEAKAIDLALELLRGGGRETRFVNWSLKADVGMTCGGTVRLFFEACPPAGSAWPIVIFGAGHIAQTLVRVLLPLPCSITVCDARAEWTEQLPRARNLRILCSDTPADLVPALPDNAFVLCMTKGHTTDRPVLQRALAERKFPYLGVIGSQAKAAILRRELVANGLTPERAKDFFCPVGLEFGTNHPQEIALSIAAQLLSERDRLAEA